MFLKWKIFVIFMLFQISRMLLVNRSIGHSRFKYEFDTVAIQSWFLYLSLELCYLPYMHKY